MDEYTITEFAGLVIGLCIYIIVRVCMSGQRAGKESSVSSLPESETTPDDTHESRR